MEQWGPFILECAVATLCACMDFFSPCNILKEAIVFFWPSPLVYCKFWGDFVVIDGESESKKIIILEQWILFSVIGCFAYRLFLKCAMFWGFCCYCIFLESTWSKSSYFLPKVVACKTIEVKLETKSFFSRPGSQMVMQSILYLWCLKAIFSIHQNVILNWGKSMYD